MARPTEGPEPDFDQAALAEFRRRVESRFVGTERGNGPRFADLAEDELEARFVVALRARARWADREDFARALVEPSVAVDRPKEPDQ